jgi:tetratricopeptide (TPR) repeat protein
MILDMPTINELFDLAVRHHKSGNLTQAQALYQQILQADPANARALHLLGIVAYQSGRHHDAIALIRKAIVLAPTIALFRFNLGNVHKDLEQLGEAIYCYRQALDINPNFAEALTNLGTCLKLHGQLAAAIGCYRQAADANPNDADVRNNLGRALKDQGQVVGAIESYRHALRINPNHAMARNNLGIALQDQGELAEAIECFRQVLRVNPNFADANFYLGSALFEEGQLDEATRHYRQALHINPSHAEAHNNLGIALEKQGQLAEAAACFRQALCLNPNYADAHSGLGHVLIDQGQLVEAIECCRQALRINPKHAGAHINMGAALNEQGELGKADECFRQAMAIDPNNVRARLNRSCLRLLQGDLVGGWPDYEMRLALRGVVPRSFQQPRWDGSPLDGKTIFIHAEQGLGDTLLCIRYVRLVKERGGLVVLECQPSLVPLLEGVAGIDQIVPQGQPGNTGADASQLPHFDVHIPLMSLPGVFGTTMSTIPGDVPYLRADPELIDRWRRELAALDGFKIGIAWQGNPQNARDRQRSVPLNCFEPLARLQGIRLVSLQKGLGTEQLIGGIGKLPNSSQLEPGLIASPSQVGPIIDFGDRLDASGAFLDTAAVMLNLDLVVTVDTAVAHMAGALGVPTWVVLPFTPDWRWLLERSDSPWYPTLRLFRQKRTGEWGEVFERIAAEVQSIVARK